MDAHRLSLLLGRDLIQAKVEEIADQIRKDAGNEIPMFICVLKGAVVFCTDLMRAYDGKCEVSFIRLASYTGTETTGKVSVMMGLTDAIKDRYVVIVEDIVDTGITMRELIQQIESNNPKTIRVAALFSKPSRRKCEVQVDFSCFEIPDKFIVGYGLDYDNIYRNLPDIYEVKFNSELAKQKKNIVIFGAPGSGKGTQSDKIVEKYGFKHISTGDVLRAEIKNGTELGKTASSYIEKGQLIPDQLMIDILASVYDSLGEYKGVIFDGFPRTVAQAESLEGLLKERNSSVSAMIDLEVADDILMERLINRGKTSGRTDDNEATISKRLNVYKTQTSPLIDWYKKAGKYNHIDGVGDLDRIFQDICKIIDNI